MAYPAWRPGYELDLEKIRASGCSTFPAEEIVGAYHVGERRGLLRFRIEQRPYSLLTRGIESSVLPACLRNPDDVSSLPALADTALRRRPLAERAAA